VPIDGNLRQDSRRRAGQLGRLQAFDHLADLDLDPDLCEQLFDVNRLEMADIISKAGLVDKNAELFFQIMLLQQRFQIISFLGRCCILGWNLQFNAKQVRKFLFFLELKHKLRKRTAAKQTDRGNDLLLVQLCLQGHLDLLPFKLGVPLCVCVNPQFFFLLQAIQQNKQKHPKQSTFSFKAAAFSAAIFRSRSFRCRARSSITFCSSCSCENATRSTTKSTTHLATTFFACKAACSFRASSSIRNCSRISA
jgi:hypothetical protein